MNILVFTLLREKWWFCVSNSLIYNFKLRCLLLNKYFLNPSCHNCFFYIYQYVCLWAFLWPAQVMTRSPRPNHCGGRATNIQFGGRTNILSARFTGALWLVHIAPAVVYFDQLLGACQKLVELLFSAVFKLFCSFFTFFSDFTPDINKKRLKMNK